MQHVYEWISRLWLPKHAKWTHPRRNNIFRRKENFGKRYKFQLFLRLIADTFVHDDNRAWNFIFWSSTKLKCIPVIIFQNSISAFIQMQRTREREWERKSLKVTMKMRSTTVASPFDTNLWNCEIIRLNNLSFFFFFLSVCSCSFCELNCILMRNWIFSCDFSPSHKSDFRRTIVSGKNIPCTIVLLWKMEKFSDVISNSFFVLYAPQHSGRWG